MLAIPNDSGCSTAKRGSVVAKLSPRSALYQLNRGTVPDILPALGLKSYLRSDASNDYLLQVERLSHHRIGNDESNHRRRSIPDWTLKNYGRGRVAPKYLTEEILSLIPTDCRLRISRSALMQVPAKFFSLQSSQ